IGMTPSVILIIPPATRPLAIHFASMNVFPLQSDHPLFRYFTDDERTRVEELGDVRKVREGDFLIRAGDTDSTLFAVEHGHLDIVANRDGNATVVATVGPGDVLGEVSFIDDSPRTVPVQAGEPAFARAGGKKPWRD